MELKWHQRPEIKIRERRKWLLQTYNLTPEQYNQMFQEQEGRCKICSKHQIDLPRSLSVDHDHNCCPGDKSCGNCIRGLICDRCNHGLGHFQDDPELLQKAINYLKEYLHGE